VFEARVEVGQRHVCESTVFFMAKGGSWYHQLAPQEVNQQFLWLGADYVAALRRRVVTPVTPRESVMLDTILEAFVVTGAPYEGVLRCGGDRSTMLYNLHGFVESKSGKLRNPHYVTSVQDELAGILCDLVPQQPMRPPPTIQDLMAIFPRLPSETTAGIWGALQVPGVTKKRDLSATSRTRICELALKMDDSWRSGKPLRAPCYVVNKVDKYSAEKVEKCKIRTIQYWDVVHHILFVWYSTFGGESFDTWVAGNRFPLNEWAMGSDMHQIAAGAAALQDVYGRTTTIDVSGWDRSLPLEFTGAYMHYLYSRLGLPRAWLRCMLEIDLFPEYVVDGQTVIHLRESETGIPCSSWCSGKVDTLRGNCLINAAVIRAFRKAMANKSLRDKIAASSSSLIGIVLTELKRWAVPLSEKRPICILMGDDNIISGDFDEQEVIRFYSMVGMEARPEEKSTFCGGEPTSFGAHAPLMVVLGRHLTIPGGALCRTPDALASLFAAAGLGDTRLRMQASLFHAVALLWLSGLQTREVEAFGLFGRWVGCKSSTIYSSCTLFSPNSPITVPSYGRGAFIATQTYAGPKAWQQGAFQAQGRSEATCPTTTTA